MSKFSGPASRPITRQSDALTHEGGKGYTRSTRQELFLQAVVEMAEDTFYEAKEDRRTRLASNVQKVVSEQGGWAFLCNFTNWLRRDAGMRSASVMVAAEAVNYSAARIVVNGEITPRQLVSSAILRADEPAEMLGYWLANHGRKIPAPMKRGIADSAVRLYNERNVLKYDGQSRSVRMGDVVDLTHPIPKDDQQSALFKFVLDRRHKREDLDLSMLPIARMDTFLMSLPEDERMEAFSRGFCDEACWDWQRVAGWLPGGLTAKIWGGLIPSLGYFATVRNLRNFDEAGINKTAKKTVANRISDPEQVRKSMLFPYRFLSAYKATNSVTWNAALEAALDESVNNIPAFDGKTLVLVDTSGSMQSSVGGERSQTMRCDVAALFGAALATRNPGKVDVSIYASYVAPFPVYPGASVLRTVEQMQRAIGSVGHGTNTWDAVRSRYKDHDRIVVLTDEQSHDYGKNPGCWMHFINLAGYRVGTAPQDKRTFAYGGFTDNFFSLLPLMEQGYSGRWPWEQ